MKSRSWYPGRSSYVAHVHDALLAAQIDTVLFEDEAIAEFRCTYRRVSAPTYAGADFDSSYIEKIADQMVTANVRCVQISGLGETTMLAHSNYCLLLQRGIGVRITSNFANRFSDDEIDAPGSTRRTSQSALTRSIAPC